MAMKIAQMAMNANGTADLSSPSLVVFLLAAFGIAWGSIAALLAIPDTLEQIFGPLSAHHPLFILAVYAPAISAFGLVLARGGIPGFRRFLGRLALWRIPAGWAVFLVLGIPAVYYLAAWLMGAWPVDLFPFESAGAALSAVTFMLILGPMEEFGWRGVALPILQRHMAPIWAGALLGLIWGIWHLPAFYLSGTPQSSWDFAPFLIGSVAVSLILTPLFNAARGSILIAALFHFQLNNPFWPNAQPWDMYLFAFVAFFTVGANWRTMTTRADAATRVIPAAAA